MRTDDSVEKRGLKVAIRYLRSLDLHPVDVSAEKLGYDIQVGRRKIEVKASKKGYAWMYLDIRKLSPTRYTKTSANIHVPERPLPEVIEVVFLDGPGSPRIYHYPPAVVRCHGKLSAVAYWWMRVPPSKREKYRRG